MSKLLLSEEDSDLSNNMDDVILDSDDDDNNNDNDNNNDDDDDNNDNNVINNIFIDSEKNILDINKKYVENDERITKNKITKYERVRILGLRIKQISLGAKPLIKHDNILELTASEIVDLEYKNKTIPFKIRRPLPNNTYEIWKFNELV